jgi:hypothetical protein
MLKRSTWVWLVIFLAVLGVFLFLKYRPAPAVEESTPTAVASNYLFTEADGALIRIRIFDRQYHIVLMERPSGGLWTLVLPTPGPADQAKAEAGATQVGALKIVDTLRSSQPLSSIGLDSPTYVMSLTFQNGIAHKLEIGDKTPSGSGYYTRLDGGTVYIVSSDGISELLNLLTTPPYLSVTSTPGSTPGSTLGPDVTPQLVTPTP